MTQRAAAKRGGGNERGPEVHAQSLPGGTGWDTQGHCPRESRVLQGCGDSSSEHTGVSCACQAVRKGEQTAPPQGSKGCLMPKGADRLSVGGCREPRGWRVASVRPAPCAACPQLRDVNSHIPRALRPRGHWG